MIIAIDGPAGAGKSTLAKRIAQTLNLQLVETGALYRAVGLLAKEQGVGLAVDDAPSLAEIAENLQIHFQYQDGVNHVFVNDRDVTTRLRTQEAGQHASQLSAYPQVRAALLGQQRTLADQHPSVLEGRDIGTVVCPHATYKFFVTASPEVRAKRRVIELESRGESGDYDTILRQIVERDLRDSTRDIAPLIPAEDAIHIDTGTRGVEEILSTMLAHIHLGATGGTR